VAVSGSRWHLKVAARNRRQPAGEAGQFLLRAFVLMKHSSSLAVRSPRRTVINTHCGEASPKNKVEIAVLVSQLTQASGISNAEARKLIKLVGTDWPTLLRRAGFLKAR